MLQADCSGKGAPSEALFGMAPDMRRFVQQHGLCVLYAVSAGLQIGVQLYADAFDSLLWMHGVALNVHSDVALDFRQLRKGETQLALTQMAVNVGAEGINLFQDHYPNGTNKQAVVGVKPRHRSLIAGTDDKPRMSQQCSCRS